MDIQVDGLGKRFAVRVQDPGIGGALRALFFPHWREVTALDGVSFEVPAGGMVGFIGPNGAGKSTTVKILSGILVPDTGSVRVGGLVPWERRLEHVARLGVVFGQRTQLWWDLPVAESFDLLRDIYRIPPADYTSRRDELTGRLDLGPLLGVPVRQLSLGQRMRCDLAAALLHRPSLLFLDEPTIGLDAPTKLVVREFLRTVNRELGVTVLLTTHDLDDIEALCPRIIVIHRGRLLLDGTPASLRARVRPERRLVIDLEGDLDPPVIPEARLLQREGRRFTFAFDPAVIPVPVLLERITVGSSIRDLMVEHPPIEEIVAEYYQGLE